MEHYYNVVWADDDVQSLLEDYKSLFETNGINIVPFMSAKPAIDYIRNHFNCVDGIIVDAKFSKEGEAVQEEDKSFPGLSLFMQELKSLRNESNMPYPCWIFTGYGDLLRDKYDKDDLSGFEDEIIMKGSNYSKMKEWVRVMCKKIALTQSKEFKLRQENAKLFELCTESYLGKHRCSTLLGILACDRKKAPTSFNNFRYILEDMMELLVRDGFIENITTRTAINNRISQLEKKYKNRLPQYVIPSLKLLLVSSSISHSGSQEEMDVSNNEVPHMYDQLLITLKNILPWFKSFVDKERDIKAARENNIGIGEVHGCSQNDDSTPIDNDLQESGILIASWSVKLNPGKYTGKYARIAKDKVQRSWKPGLQMSVIISEDENGKLYVKEILSVGV